MKMLSRHVKFQDRGRTLLPLISASIMPRRMNTHPPIFLRVKTSFIRIYEHTAAKTGSIANINAVCVGETCFCAAFWIKNAKTVAKMAVIIKASKITILNSNGPSVKLKKRENRATVPIWIVVIKKVSIFGEYFPTKIICIAKENAHIRIKKSP